VRRHDYAGRSITKRKGEAPFPTPKGSPAQLNEQGRRALDRILDHPAANTSRYVHKRYGTILQVKGPPSVGGVRYQLDANGKITRMIGFIRPPAQGGRT